MDMQLLLRPVVDSSLLDDMSPAAGAAVHIHCKSEEMSKKSAAKRKVREADDVDWDALLGEELEGGVDLDDMGRVLVNNSKIW